MRPIKITNSEANILDHIATVLQMDCWLYIDQKNNFFDLETGEELDPKNAIIDVIEGMNYLDFIKQNKHWFKHSENQTFLNLLERLKIRKYLN